MSSKTSKRYRYKWCRVVYNKRENWLLSSKDCYALNDVILPLLRECGSVPITHIYYKLYKKPGFKDFAQVVYCVKYLIHFLHDRKVIGFRCHNRMKIIWYKKKKKKKKRKAIV